MNKKNLWSLLAIMMVSVLSLGFVACSDDDDDDKDTVGTYYVTYDLTDKGNLEEEDIYALEDAMEDLFEDDVYVNAKLSDVVKGVKAMVKANGSAVCEAFPGKSFTVTIYISDENKAVKEKITVKCKNGKLA